MSSIPDWINDLESEANEDDNLTYYEWLTRAIYKSRHGFGYWWPRIIAMVEDDELTTERGIYSATDAKEETKKRANREK